MSNKRKWGAYQRQYSNTCMKNSFSSSLERKGFTTRSHASISRQNTRVQMTHTFTSSVCVNKVKPVSDFNDSLVMKVSDIPNNSVSGCSPVEIWKNLCIKIRSIPETQNSRNVPLAKIPTENIENLLTYEINPH